MRAFDSKAASPLVQNSNAELDRLRQLKDEVGMWSVVGKSNRPPCFDCLVQDINVVLQMHESAVVDGPLDFLLTGRLNQDCIKNFFSQVRAKSGHRFNPTAREFRFAYRSLCSNMILASIPSANCSFDSDVMLSSFSRLSRAACRTRGSDVGAEGCETPAKSPRLTKDRMQPFDATDFEVATEISNFLNYIAGYLIHKLQKSDGFDCNRCLSSLVICNSDTVEDSQMYLHLRAYTYRKGTFGGLTAPSPLLVQVLKHVENLFGKRIQGMLASEHLYADMSLLVFDNLPMTTVAVCTSHADVGVLLLEV